MKPHRLADHDLGADAPLNAPLEPFEEGANREHVLRLVVAHAEQCEVHATELVRLVAHNVGSSTLILGLAMNRVYREFGIVGIPVVRQLPGMAVVLANLGDAAAAGAEPGTAMRDTLGAMAPKLRRTVVAGAVDILNAPTMDDLLR
jgi:hypothetical protein